MKQVHIIVYCFVFLVVNSCETEDMQAFKKAKEENTIEAWLKFQLEFPESEHIEKAISKSQTLIDKADTETFEDPRDGQVYKTTIMRDGRVWMSENMRYSGGMLSNGSLCYENKESNCDDYGRLYTWEAVQNICPPGWHVPTDNEWWELIQQYGGAKQTGGGKSRTNATEGKKAYFQIVEDSNFNVQFGGFGNSPTRFNLKGKAVGYWTSTKSGTSYYVYYFFQNKITQNYKPNDSVWYRSCRCIRD